MLKFIQASMLIFETQKNGGRPLHHRTILELIKMTTINATFSESPDYPNTVFITSEDSSPNRIVNIFEVTPNGSFNSCGAVMANNTGHYSIRVAKPAIGNRLIVTNSDTPNTKNMGQVNPNGTYTGAVYDPGERNAATLIISASDPQTGNISNAQLNYYGLIF
jgi:hypothetical protein